MGTHSRKPHGETGRDGGGDDLPVAVIGELRSEPRRRELLAVLAAASEPMPLIDLARAVAARERGIEPDRIDSETVATVRDEIYEETLPKLTATGVVTFDSLVSTVELATDDERLLGSD